MATTKPLMLVSPVLCTETQSILDSSSVGSSSPCIASPSSAATSFELPSKSAVSPVIQDIPESTVAFDPSRLEATAKAEPALPSTRLLSFLSLPSDLHHLILTEYLPYETTVALRSTSSYFQSLISAPTLKRLRQNVIRRLLDEERQLLKKWLPQPYSRYSGRPNVHMTCYSCLQSRPVTDFFLAQVSHNRGLGRKRAGERWCKPCGLKYGKIRQGRWMEEVSYGPDDRYRYETVMSLELKVENPCMKCPSKHRYEGQPVWWGCVDCFEKEELRLRKQDSERRRDLLRHCRKAKRGAQSLMDLGNLAELSHEAGWWMRNKLSWGGMVSRSYRVIWWFTDDSPWNRMCRTCQRASSWIDDTQWSGAGGRIGRKARGTFGNILSFGTKQGGHQVREINPLSEETDDCIICSGTLLELATEQAAVEAEKPKCASPTSHGHICQSAPRREVRCWQCWRAKRSRRRRRHDNGAAYGLPLPQDRWCGGCNTEHRRFIELKRERKTRHDGEVRARAAALHDATKSREDADDSQEIDVNLEGLFGNA